MSEQDWLGGRFEAQRPQLRAVARRLLGSATDADDAVQEAWLRVSRADIDAIGNLGGWLTTIVARVALDMLRSRTSRRELPLLPDAPDRLAHADPGADPSHDLLVADAIGPALLVVLETLAPAERVAFVLHDLFAVPFDEIAPIVDRTPAAARQLASRARRRVQGAPLPATPGLAEQRPVVAAFMAASRAGDFAGLVAVLAPDVVRRDDAGPGGAIREVRGAAAIAAQALMFSQFASYRGLALINGALGLVTVPLDRPPSVLRFTIVGERITAIEIITQPARIRALDLTLLRLGPAADDTASGKPEPAGSRLRESGRDIHGPGLSSH